MVTEIVVLSVLTLSSTALGSVTVTVTVAAPEEVGVVGVPTIFPPVVMLNPAGRPDAANVADESLEVKVANGEPELYATPASPVAELGAEVKP
jgi:hypothetical protein